MNSLERYIELFDKKTELFVKRIKLPSDLKLEELKKLFGVNDNDPEMIYVYDVTTQHLEFFIKECGLNLDLDKYDYQICCYAKTIR